MIPLKTRITEALMPCGQAAIVSQGIPTYTVSEEPLKKLIAESSGFALERGIAIKRGYSLNFHSSEEATIERPLLLPPILNREATLPTP